MFPIYLSRLLKGSAMIALAGSLMGNEGCKKAPETRELRRRVQIGDFKTPTMGLPGGASFDFEFAAKTQFFQALKETKSFSSSSISSGAFVVTPQDQQMIDQFNTCSAVSVSAQSKQTGISRKLSQQATCMIRAPQGRVSTNILSYEVTSGGGITLGLPALAGFGASFKMVRAKLFMTMIAEDPLIANKVIAASRYAAKGNEFKVSATIPLEGISITPELFFKTALADVTYKALKENILDLKSQWNEQEPWYATVLKDCDKAILINAGNASDAGLKVGDVFEVRNVFYDWDDDPCASDLLGAMPSPQIAALVKVTTVGDTFSMAEVIDQNPEIKIQPGARVMVRKLVEPPVPAQSVK